MNSLKKYIVVSALTSALCLFSTGSIAAGGHGAGGGSGNKSGGGCKSTVINHFEPGHFETVAPKSKFSFWVRGINDPKLIEVTAKKLPVELSVEDKKTFFEVTGTLPESLSNTAARIQVNVHAPKCPADKGWLLKITE